MFWEAALVVLIAILIGIGSLFLTTGLLQLNLIPTLIGIPMISLGIVLILRCFKSVPEEMSIILVKFGAFYKEKRGGLRIVQVPGVIKIRAVVPRWIQGITIFDGKEEIHFKRGSAFPVLTLYVKVIDAYKAVFRVRNWREFVKDGARQVLNDLLPTKTLDEWLIGVSPGANLIPMLQAINRAPVDDFIRRCRDVGIEVVSLVIEAWNLPSDVVKKRHEVYNTSLEKEIAEIRREILLASEARYVTKIKDVLMNYGWEEPEAKRKAEEIFDLIVAGRVGELRVFLTPSELAGIVQQLKQTLRAL